MTTFVERPYLLAHAREAVIQAEAERYFRRRWRCSVVGAEARYPDLVLSPRASLEAELGRRL